MTISISPIVQATDSFGQWLAKTNLAVNAITYFAVTTNSNTAVGNAAVTGTFTSNNFVTSNSGSVFVGFNSAANAVINASALVFQSTSTSNSIVSSSGMLLADTSGTTVYTKTLISMGNTVIRTANVSSNSANFSDYVLVGNTILYNNSIVINQANILNTAIGTSALVGDADANTYIDRTGIYIKYNDNLPDGDTNAYFTAYELKVGKVTTSNLNIDGSLSIFKANTLFNGASNYFKYGITANATSNFEKINVNGSSSSYISGPIEFSNTVGIYNHSGSNLNIKFGESGYPANLLSYGNWNLNGNIAFTTGNVNFKNGIKIENTNSNNVTIVANNITDNYTLTLPFNNGDSGQVLTTDGNGTLSWGYTLGSPVKDFTARSIGVGTAASGLNGDIRAIGNITAYFSDERLKDVIGPIDNALDKVSQLEGFYYKNNDTARALGYKDGRTHVGISAQKAQEILPEIVYPAPIGGGYLTVQYDKIVPLLIEAIKELKAEVDRLKNGN